MEKSLENTVTSLRGYVGDDIAGAIEYKLPPRAASRAFEYNGGRYQVRLSRVKAARPGYLLSVMKEAGSENWERPGEKDGAAIAAAFFPGGYSALPLGAGAARIERKYFSLDEW